MIIARAVENWYEAVTYSVFFVSMAFAIWCICHYGWPWQLNDDELDENDERS